MTIDTPRYGHEKRQDPDEEFCPMHGEVQTFVAPFPGYVKEPNCFCPMMPAPTPVRGATIPLTARFHPQVQYVTGGPWCPPSVGNIKDGYKTEEEVADLFRVLREHDRDYYARANFRIVKEAREVTGWREG